MTATPKVADLAARVVTEKLSQEMLARFLIGVAIQISVGGKPEDTVKNLSVLVNGALDRADLPQAPGIFWRNLGVSEFGKKED